MALARLFFDSHSTSPVALYPRKFNFAHNQEVKGCFWEIACVQGFMSHCITVAVLEMPRSKAAASDVLYCFPRILEHHQWTCLLPTILLHQSPHKPAHRQWGSNRRDRCAAPLCVSTTFIKSHEGSSVIVHESLKPLCTTDEASNPFPENPGFHRQHWQGRDTDRLEFWTRLDVFDGSRLTIAG